MFFQKKKENGDSTEFKVLGTEHQGIPILEGPDRAFCIKKLEEAFSMEKKRKGAVLKIYIENFKLFNDTFGYEYGGFLLEEIVHFLQELTDGRVYRYGGVEFLLILDGASHAQADEIAQQIRDRFECAWRINDLDCMCTVNLGMIFYPERAQEPEELLQKLEHAVSASAFKGANQLSVYNQELEDSLLRKSYIGKFLKTALANGTIDLRYRPTYHMERGLFTRAEGYLRLLTPDLGVISSAEFLPVAEEVGLICAVNLYELNRTCAFIHRLMDVKKDFESVAVQISPIMLLQESFPQEVREILAKNQIPAGKLALEMTESVLIHSYSRMSVVMQELSEMGVEIVLNEFGTGYSGINNILDLPVDVLKLERMFVWQLETNPRSGCIIEGLIAIAKNLGMKLIAEGVETAKQKELLSKFGCPYEQGFFYSPTVDASELEALFPNL